MAIVEDRRAIVISGPSGVGKGTLVKRLKGAYPNTFVETVSHTTRQPRPGEVEGSTYFFVSPATFSSHVSQNAFLEHVSFCGNHYGTSRQTVVDQQAKGHVVLLDIEIQGVRQMRDNSSIDARYVFIKPPSFDVLEARLRGRSTEDETHIQERLAQARVELAFADTPGVFHKVIINDDLEKAYGELERYVFGWTSSDVNGLWA